MSDEEALKRSARRRLIGAVALALVTVVALPMIFDKEPPPLADVEIVIPSRDTPGKSVILDGDASKPATPSPSASGPSPALTAPAPVPPVSPALTPNAPAPAPKASDATSQIGERIDLPKPASRVTGTIFLQLGVFSSEEGARRLAKRVVDAGFTVHVVEDSGRYKVRCGPVSGKPAAQTLQAQLQAKGFAVVQVKP